MASGSGSRLSGLMVLVLAFFARSISAQTALNTTILNGTSDAQLFLYQTGNAANNAPIPVAVSGPSNSDNQVKPSWADRYNGTGILTLIGSDNYTKLTQTQNGTIAYISCDQGDYDNGFIKFVDVISSVVGSLGLASSQAQYVDGAILLYSKSSNWCSVDTTMYNRNIFTMTSASTSEQLYNALTNGSYVNQISWIADHRDIALNGTYGADGATSINPTTTIAMIVLYSVTGIITFMFLLIIVLGAIRAHRHPERYGPRNILGLPRQSRARGMARAVLDTIPIVKFGETNQTKPADGTRDVELGERNTGTAPGEGTSVNETNVMKKGDQPVVQTIPASELTDTPTDVPGAETVHVEPNSAGVAASEAEAVQCPICTEDFVRGEPARHLPCNHHFHPTCIDPWLLNVSSTCPLCRVDLNPPSEGESVQATTNSQETDARPARHGFAGRLGFLDLRTVGNATREERIEALRQVREERAGRETDAQDSSRRNRFSRLFPSNRQSQAIAEPQHLESNGDLEAHAQRETALGGSSTSENSATATA